MTTLDCTIVPVEVRNIPEIFVRIPSLHHQLYKWVTFFCYATASICDGEIIVSSMKLWKLFTASQDRPGESDRYLTAIHQ